MITWIREIWARLRHRHIVPVKGCKFCQEDLATMGIPWPFESRNFECASKSKGEKGVSTVNTNTPNTNTKNIQATEDYKIVRTRPPSDERDLFGKSWCFLIDGPGHHMKTFVGNDEACGSHFIQALQHAYDAGYRRGTRVGLDDLAGL